MISKKSLLRNLLLIVLSVAGCELLLQTWATVSPKKFGSLFGTTPFIIPDSSLTHRPNPDFAGHDKNGFRNASVLDAVDIVTLGDSQTYGMGVERDSAWPAVLARSTTKRVYSMAFGGWGPTHSLTLMDAAIAVRPKLIIEAFYSGNDLYDSFDHVYCKHRLEQLKSHDAGLLAAISSSEGEERIETKVQSLYRMGKTAAPSVNKSGFKSLLGEHSKLYLLLFRVKELSKRLWQTVAQKPESDAQRWDALQNDALTKKEYTQVLERENVRTVFTPEYRLSAVDLTDPRIKEGQRIALRAILQMKEKADVAGIGFLVLLIPTKELVHKNLVRLDATSTKEAYRNLILNEEAMWTSTKEFFLHHGIEFLDSTPLIQHQAEIGDLLYPQSTDGHPNPRGHNTLARAVKAKLAALGL